MAQNTNKRNGPPPIVFILLGLIVLGAGIKFIPDLFKGKNFAQSGSTSPRISLGSQILVTSQTTPEKQEGVQAFTNSNYKEAIQHFQASLQQTRNDPETVIYLNNAKASEQSALKIAVSVPIATNPNVAQEILRGVAQAQDEINNKGGIKGALLQVEIVNDDNNPDIVKEVAKALADDPKVLAVIGHNDSTASLAGAPIYQQKGLVMITPTSTTNNLSGFGSYIFRTGSSEKLMAVPLAEYIVKTARKTNIAICNDSQSAGSISFKDEFIASLLASGGKLIPIVCDFSAPTFNPSTAIADAVSKGANGMVLSPQVDRIALAINLASANQGKLALYGTTTLYTFQTLKDGKKDVNGLVLPAPWHPESNPNNPFAQNASQRWGGVVNWRTATSFDATQAIIAGLQQSNTREGLQQTLRNPSFSTIGSSDNVKFLPTGDRAGKTILVEVKPKGGNDYTFVPIR